MVVRCSHQHMLVNSKLTLKKNILMMNYFFLCISLIFPCLMNAQSATVSSGGEGSGLGGTVSFSIGQLVVESTVDSEGSISPGVQHAVESMVTFIDENVLCNILTVYPNPTTERIHCSFDQVFIGEVCVFDHLGQCVFIQALNAQEMSIDVSKWSTGAYLMHFLIDDRSAAIHRIVKN